ACVTFARDRGLPLAVRGGGHSVPGFGTVDDGIVADLAGLRRVTVDPERRTARVQGGATWADFNDAANVHGLATTGGIISTTGVAGLTMGGGIGYLARGFGLSCDNLLSARIVTADGSTVTASEEANLDLFWAIRGGGGNFGVATELEFRLHPVKDIYGGPMFFDLKDAGTVLRFFREFIAEAPEAFGGFPGFHLAPPLPFVPEARHLEPMLAVVACWSGPIEDGEGALKPLHDVAQVVAEHVGPMPYPALNAAFDGLVPAGLQHYWKANFVGALSDAAIEAHLDHAPTIPVVNTMVHLYPVNGAVHRVASDATAFAYRDATLATVIAGMWPDPARNEANIAWVRDYSASTAPLSEEGGYINFMAGDDQDRIRANYRGNYDRLVAIKRRYDPDNVFRVNQNIRA
ncbi:MAG: FAD-binding oxidoreductase, partial [Candidatus Limnocylindrales bacterium]